MIWEQLPEIRNKTFANRFILKGVLRHRSSAHLHYKLVMKPRSHRSQFKTICRTWGGSELSDTAAIIPIPPQGTHKPITFLNTKLIPARHPYYSQHTKVIVIFSLLSADFCPTPTNTAKTKAIAPAITLGHNSLHTTTASSRYYLSLQQPRILFQLTPQDYHFKYFGRTKTLLLTRENDYL